MRPLIPDDDPQQFARLEDRIRRLEQSQSILSVPFPTAASFVDVPVPLDANIVTLDFECEYPFGSNVLLRPNGDATALLTDYFYTQSTASPNSIGAVNANQISYTGLFVSGNFGAAGAVRVVGSATVVTRQYSGRTMMQSYTHYTNTVGSANSYLVSLHSAATYDLSTPISYVRFTTSAGNFNGGVVRASYA